MSPLSSLSLVIQMQGKIFSTKTFALVFSYISQKYLQNLQLHWSCLLSFYANSRCSELKLWLYFSRKESTLEYQNFVCSSSDLNILEFPILMLLDSRQRLSNNLSDHFIDQILKMFIYLTRGERKSRKRNTILQIK